MNMNNQYHNKDEISFIQDAKEAKLVSLLINQFKHFVSLIDQLFLADSIQLLTFKTKFIDC